MRSLSWAYGLLCCVVLLFGKLLATLAFVNILQRPKSTGAPASTRRTISMTASKTQKMYSSEEDAVLPFRHSSTVFIEMTDMYGIVFYGNYITYVRRAMEAAFGAAAPRVHSLHDMKFRAAATLGEEAVVEGSLVSCDPARERSRWRFQITNSDPSRLFVSGEATLSWPGSADGAEEAALPPGHFESPSAAMTRDGEARQGRDDETKLLQPLPEAFANTPKTLEVTVWSDDVERSGNDGVGELTIRAVLNYFERIRTLCVGREPDGELGLMRLHREGFSVVVTNISDLRIHSRGVVAGEKLEVRLGAKLTRGGKILNVYETLWRGDETLIAHAEIVLLCMDNETRKFRPIPSWVQDIIKVPFATRAD